MYNESRRKIKTDDIYSQRNEKGYFTIQRERKKENKSIMFREDRQRERKREREREI